MTSVIIAYVKVGGGHQNMANIIHKKLDDNQISNKIVDVLEEDKKFFTKFFSLFYQILIDKLFLIWFFLIFLQRIRIFRNLFLKVIKLTHYSFLEDLFIKEKPDFFVSTYYFFDAIAIEIIKKHNLPTKVYTVVSDFFSPESIWFLSKDSRYLLFSKNSYNLALKNNIASQNLFLLPFVVKNSFHTEEKTIANITKRLTFYFDKKNIFDIFNNLDKKQNILILGGGNGLKNSDKLAKIILKQSPSLKNIWIVCGRNKELYQKCLKLGKNNPKIKVFGYVDIILELIFLSDLVVTKAGPNSVLEILAQKKPVFLFDYIWPQEKGVLDFVLKNKLGIYENNINKMAIEIKNYLKNIKIFNNQNNKDIIINNDILLEFFDKNSNFNKNLS